MVINKENAADSIKKRAEKRKSGFSNGGLSNRQQSRRKQRRHLLKKAVGEEGFHSMSLYIASLGVILWFTLSGTVLYQHPYPPHEYVVGQVIEESVYADIEFSYTDHNQTERERREAIEEEPLVFVIDKETSQKRLALLDKVHQYFRDTENTETVSEDATVLIEKAASPEMRNILISLLETISEQELGEIIANDQWRSELAHALYAVLQQGVRPKDADDLFLDRVGPRHVIRIMDPMEEERSFLAAVEDVPMPEQAVERVLDKLRNGMFPYESVERATAEIIAAEVIVSNLLFERSKTEEYREQAAAGVEPVLTTVTAGELLIERGEILTHRGLQRIKHHLRELEPNTYQPVGPVDIASTMALMLLLLLGFGGGLVLFNRNALESRGQILLIALLLLAQSLLARGTIHIFHVREIPLFYLMAALPAAIAALFAAQLVDLRTAVWITVFTSLVTGLQAGNTMELFVAGCIGGSVGALLVYRARLRVHMFWGGVWLGLIFFFVVAVFSLSRGTPAEAFGRLAIVALTNGLGSAILVSTLMPLFEYSFGLVTDISLLELSDLNHPLLRRLQIEAPGTFHHSLMVAILAEQAAKAVGANPLLARVCAYFHDVGKIFQSEYFVENTMASGSRDAHSNLQPRMSSLIILNHVKEGLALAANYKLNKTMREAIAQHHGTSLIYYFYRRAAEKQEKSDREKKSIGQHDYRYPGPLPVRKEVVLIGIADACEAAARALQKPTPQRLKSLVGEIIRNKMYDGQLDKADLTFEELAVARDAMVKTLCTMYHGRISYPDDKEKGKEKRKDGSQTDSESEESKDKKPAENGRGD